MREFIKTFSFGAWMFLSGAATALLACSLAFNVAIWTGRLMSGHDYLTQIAEHQEAMPVKSSTAAARRK